MPDHIHLWMGIRTESDQLLFLRTALRPCLGEGREWQHQPHDHVLRPEERRRNAFRLSCSYVLQNPARAALASRPEEWPYSGALIPGFPRLNVFEEGFWERFWRIYAEAREVDLFQSEESASHSSAATPDD